MPRKTPQTEDFWHAFAAHGRGGARDYEVVAFGDSRRMASELAALVLAGTKRATASLRRDYAPGRAPLPNIGD